MNPIIKKKIAIFHPQGFLDGGNAKSVIDANDIKLVTSSKIRCEIVLVSLKKIIFFNRRGLSAVLENLQLIGNKLGAMIGFCDYDDKKYKMIMDMYEGHVPFTLFDTEKIGALFSGSIQADNAKILVYNDSIEQKNKLMMELYELGFKPKSAKTLQEYEQNKSEYDYALRRSFLGSSDKAIRVHIKDNVIVYKLKGFLDSSLVDDFDMVHHENALKIGFNYFLFDAKDVSSTNVHAVNFLSKLSTAGAEFGATIAVSGLTERNITSALKDDLEDAGVLVYKEIDDFFNDDSLFGNDGGGALSEKKPRHITKKLVEILSMIVENAVATIESMTHGKLQKNSIKLQELDVNSDDEFVAVAIAFYGQIEGMMIFSFHEDLAKKACSVLIDDKSGKQDLLDALGELINIIGEKLIQHLKRKNYTHVEMTMPRTYKNVKDLMTHKKGTKGAQIDFEMDSKPLSIFITK